MKKTCVVAVLLGLGLAAEDRIPSGAKEIEPYTFSYTDAQGNKWMYRQTPFGVTKWQSSDIPAPAVKEQPNPVTVITVGDEVRFERTTPFGHNVWTRKKSELTADEKLLVGVAAERK